MDTWLISSDFVVVVQDQDLDVLVDLDPVGAARRAARPAAASGGWTRRRCMAMPTSLGSAGRAQVLDLLERPDRLQGALAELAVDLARVVVQLGQAPLQLPHRRSMLAVVDHVPAMAVRRSARGAACVRDRRVRRGRRLVAAAVAALAAPAAGTAAPTAAVAPAPVSHRRTACLIPRSSVAQPSNCAVHRRCRMFAPESRRAQADCTTRLVRISRRLIPAGGCYRNELRSILSAGTVRC